MSLLESLRKRLSHQLESHTVDDDYTTPPARSTSSHSLASRPNFARVSIDSTGIRDPVASVTNSGWTDFASIPPPGLPPSPPPPINVDTVSDNRSIGHHSIDPYDPDEAVPSYESSQLLHEQQRHRVPRAHEHPVALSLPVSSNVTRSNSTAHMVSSNHHPRSISQTNLRATTAASARRTSTNHTISNRAFSLYDDDDDLDDTFPTDNNNNDNDINDEILNNDNDPRPSWQSNPMVATMMMMRNNSDGKRSLKKIGLKFLNARQHFLLASCRDLSLIPPLIGLFQSWKRVFWTSQGVNFDVPAAAASVVTTGSQFHDSITTARISEHFLTGVWCVVAGYLSYSVLDGLMLRWIVHYSTAAAIVRMLSMSTIIVAIEQYLAATFSAHGYKYGLHIWILISCCLTLTYIVQNFVTSNLDLKGKRRARFFDFYNIVVFAVVPVGLASFITMIGLLRALLILRLDIDQQT